MSGKRNLPAWMLTRDRGKQTLRESGQRKPEINNNKCGGKKGTRRMMYWLNERELVEAARVVLEKTRMAVEQRRDPPPDPETTAIPETDVEETTDSEVSEPDVDIAEQETLPYGTCLEERRYGGSSERPGEYRVASSSVLDKESEEEKSQADSDHEALQVLREIFFS